MEEEKLQELPYSEKKKSMDAAVKDGMAYSVMAGTGDAFIPAALVTLGASNYQIGLVAALPQLAGALLQFFSLRVLRLIKSAKAMVIGGALLHALTWLSIVALLLWPGALSIDAIILLFTLGVASTLFVNPAWSSWVSDIVPEKQRADFFASRSRITQLVLFVATFGTGMALRELGLAIGAAIAFAAVFSVAFMARMISIRFLAKMTEVKYEVQLLREIELKHLFILPAYRSELWFLAFMAAMCFSTQFAAPFFTPYMLNTLGYDLGTLGLMTAVTVLAKIAAFPYWGKAIDRFGNKSVLIATSFAVPLVPIMWLASTDFWAIISFNLLSGFVWSGFDLAAFNYALALVGRELRPSFISKYNAFSGIFNAAGAYVGGAFLASLGELEFFGIGGILMVFLISGIMRLLTIVFFSPRLASGREVENTTSQRSMVLNLVAIYPTQGAVHHALGGWNFTRKAISSGAKTGKRALTLGLGTTGQLLEEGEKLVSKITKKKGL